MTTAYSLVRLLHNTANISPLGAAGFFERIAGEDDGDEAEGMGWLASHPSPRARATAYRRDAKRGHVYTPALTAQEFAALKTACRDDRDVEEFGFF